jgi:hypothetical protein
MGSGLDRLLKVAEVLEPGHLIVVDIVIMLEQCSVTYEHLMLCFKLVNHGLELLLYQRGYFRFDQLGERASIEDGRRHEQELAIDRLVLGVG